ncbi:MAG: DNA repair protein RadC [Chitinophagaceae bacterium]|uniref:RadC family protein n=1 Tax=unclassified Paraflavitalea TaxID=2798305 RepID=UPI003D34F08A|nr:DNA repair protein RadC [Chitinophagaceae bacterium]
MQANSYSIKTWAIDDRPREKLLKSSPSLLSNAELLAILINHGNREKTAIDLAREILVLSNNELQELGRLSPHDFMKIKGIGEAKAITIAAALELGRRRSSSTTLFKKSITDSREIATFLKDQLQDLGHEVFSVVFLNRANRIIHYEIISQGGITGTVADPRIILKKALEQEAVSLILCHNHPSGNLRPSKADEMLTQKIKDAGLLMDIRVMDHIIVSQDGYYSFADEGIL